MARKLSEVADDHDQQLAQAVRTSAQQIWQAGLGAFVKAQQEQQAAGGGQAFEQLVAEGSVLQQRVRASSGEGEREGRQHGADADDGGDADDAADIRRQAASGSWDKLEQVFEDRVVRALGAIGVPSKRDLAALAEQVAQLSAQVAALQRALDDKTP